MIKMNNNRRRNFRSRGQKNNFRRRGVSSNPSSSNNFGNNGNYFSRNGSVNNIHNVEKAMQKFLQLAKEAQTNGDPILAQNYLQHADHYLRRFNELSDKKGQLTDKDSSEEKVKPVRDNKLEENLSLEMKDAGSN